MYAHISGTFEILYSLILERFITPIIIFTLVLILYSAFRLQTTHKVCGSVAGANLGRSKALREEEGC